MASCRRVLEKGDREERIDDRVLRSVSIRLKKANTSPAVELLRSESFSDTKHAGKAWSLLLPDKSCLRKRHISNDFCKYIFLIYFTLQSGKGISYRILVYIRADINPLYSRAWEKMKNAKNFQNYSLVRWIDNLDGEKQGISLIALLKLRIYIEGSLRSSELLRAIVAINGQVESLKHVSDD